MFSNAEIAQVAHEANRAIQQIAGDPVVSPAWAEAPDWQRDSAINGVAAALSGMGPEELHQNWCEEKVATGWTFGETKDPEAKTHPCLVPYAALPPDQKAKDAVFSAIVAALAATEPPAFTDEEIATLTAWANEVVAEEGLPDGFTAEVEVLPEFGGVGFYLRYLVDEDCLLVSRPALSGHGVLQANAPKQMLAVALKEGVRSITTHEQFPQSTTEESK